MLILITHTHTPLSAVKAAEALSWPNEDVATLLLFVTRKSKTQVRDIDPLVVQFSFIESKYDVFRYVPSNSSRKGGVLIVDGL